MLTTSSEETQLSTSLCCDASTQTSPLSSDTVPKAPVKCDFTSQAPETYSIEANEYGVQKDHQYFKKKITAAKFSKSTPSKKSTIYGVCDNNSYLMESLSAMLSPNKTVDSTTDPDFKLLYFFLVSKHDADR